jgi:hypothetical protein
MHDPEIFDITRTDMQANEVIREEKVVPKFDKDIRIQEIITENNNGK